MQIRRVVAVASRVTNQGQLSLDLLAGAIGGVRYVYILTQS